MLSKWSTGQSGFPHEESDLALSTRGRDRRQTAREYVERRLAFRDYDDLSDVLKGAQQLDWAPSRSTFYLWVKAWRAERARDQSGPWTLANDETGRPDIVMRVIATVHGQSRGRLNSVTTTEAKWIVRVALALPGILEADEAAEYPADAGPGFGGQVILLWGAAKVLTAARRYIRAEEAGDVEQVLQEQANHAVWYVNEQRHLSELLGVDPRVIAESLDVALDAYSQTPEED